MHSRRRLALSLAVLIPALGFVPFLVTVIFADQRDLPVNLALGAAFAAMAGLGWWIGRRLGGWAPASSGRVTVVEGSRVPPAAARTDADGSRASVDNSPVESVEPAVAVRAPDVARALSLDSPADLAAQKQQIEAFLRSIGAGISIVDRDLRVIYQNDAMKATFGEHLGEYCYQVYEHKKEVCVGCPVQKAMDSGEIHHSLRRVYDKHGNLLYYESTGSPIRDDSGNVVAGLELARDITQRIKLERNVEIRSRQLATANAQLRQANQQLQKAYEDLKNTQIQLVHSEKMASLGVLVAGIAHEINNPLNFISASIQILEDHLLAVMKLVREYEANPLPVEIKVRVEDLKERIEFDFLHEDLQNNVRNIKTGAERMSQIVQNLRAFSRLDATRREDVSVQEGIESTLQILYHQYQDRIVIERDYHPTPLVPGNPSQLNQVFMNVLHNAIQSIEGAGKIGVSVRQSKGRVHISISDTGCGIDANDVKHVFDPFFTTKTVGEGTGLGLSISYGIVKDHGGDLWVESQVGKGSVFHIELPIVTPTKAARGS